MSMLSLSVADYLDMAFSLVVIGIAGGTVIWFVYNSKKSTMLRKFKKASKKRISLVKENEYVKIVGKAHDIDEPLVSPIGKRKCVYYNIIIEENHGGNGKGRAWHPIHNEEKSTLFSVESSREKAIIDANIDPNSKTVYLVKDIQHRSGTWNEAPEFLEQVLQSRGLKSKAIFGLNKTSRYQEGVIEIGEEVSVMGIGNWKESDHKFDRYSSKNLFISGDNANKLLITDDPKASSK